MLTIIYTPPSVKKKDLPFAFSLGAIVQNQTIHFFFFLSRLMLKRKIKTESNNLIFIMDDSDILSAFELFDSREKKIDPARIRTWNPLIRSQMPYPLGHGAVRIDTYRLI